MLLGDQHAALQHRTGERADEPHLERLSALVLVVERVAELHLERPHDRGVIRDGGDRAIRRCRSAHPERHLGEVNRKAPRSASSSGLHAEQARLERAVEIQATGIVSFKDAQRNDR